MQAVIRSQPEPVEKVGQVVSDHFQDNNAGGVLSSPESVGKVIAAPVGIPERTSPIRKFNCGSSGPEPVTIIIE